MVSRSRYPPGFDGWPREKQLHHMTVMYTREGLIRLCFSLALHEVGPDRSIHSKTRLTKREFAAIALALDPNRSVPRGDTP